MFLYLIFFKLILSIQTFSPNNNPNLLQLFFGILLISPTWYSDGPVCTESGVESFGGVGGNGNECWPAVVWWLWPIWPTLWSTCGSWGHANGLPHGLAGANDLCSLVSHEPRGGWKCGRHTCGDVWDDGIRDAATTTRKQTNDYRNNITKTILKIKKNNNNNEELRNLIKQKPSAVIILHICSNMFT